MRILKLSLIVCAALLVVLGIIGTAMSVDSSASAELPNTKIAWGIGPHRDADNRPTDAVAADKKYKELGGYFLLDGGVCLTFDLGYENGYTEAILDAMLERGVKGVFFITLDYAKEAPRIVRRIIDEGHILGNHTAKHNSLPDVSRQKALEDIQTLHDYVLEEFSYEMSWFRFPRGEFSERTLALASSLGYKSMFWSFAYVDWLTDKQPDPAASLDRLLSSRHEGAVYLLHAVSSTNAAIMGDFLDRLIAESVSIVLPPQAKDDPIISP